MKLDVSLHEARLSVPFVSSRDAVSARPLILVRLETDDGIVAHGEAAPLHGYDGVTVDDVLAALEDCRPLLSDSDGRELAPLRAACVQAAVIPQAVTAVDLALWDLEGRRAGQPVWRLLGADAAPTVPVNATIAAPDRAGAARRGRSGIRRRVRLREGEGRDRGRRRPACGRARGRRGRDVDPSGRQRRLVGPGGARLAADARTGRPRAVRRTGERG